MAQGVVHKKLESLRMTIFMNKCIFGVYCTFGMLVYFWDNYLGSLLTVVCSGIFLCISAAIRAPETVNVAGSTGFPMKMWLLCA